MNPYCLGWQQLKGAQKVANSQKIYEQIDAVERALRRFAKSIVSDHRKLNDVKTSCPQFADEIQALAGSSPIVISNPTHDYDSMLNWTSSLSSEEIADLEKAIKESKAAKRKNKP